MAWAPHITVATIVEQNKKFLFVKELVNNNAVINQPAGHVEDGESFVEAATRETLEETGWQIQPLYVVAIYRWVSPNNGETFFRFTFAAKPVEHDKNITLDDGIIQPLWLCQNELLENKQTLRSPMVLDSVERYLQGDNFPLDILIDL